MSILPGWDSIDSTGTISHALHITAIVVLGLLFVAEGLALIYDSRKESLTASAERTRAAEQKTREDAAEDRRKAEVEGLQSRLGGADKKVADLENAQPQRRLSAEHKSSLIVLLNPFKGQKVSITCILGDIYGKELAEDFVEVFRAAKWDDSGGVGY